MKPTSRNILIEWLAACSPAHRQRLSALLRRTREIEGQTILDTMAARLLSKCALDLGMQAQELASLLEDSHQVGREAVLELALAGIQWARAA